VRNIQDDKTALPDGKAVFLQVSGDFGGGFAGQNAIHSALPHRLGVQQSRVNKTGLPADTGS
jgi:hypothetical protein